ncbi:MAG: SpoIIIAC/SpoIIIAD family protein [Angelakisella sp.]|nr:SpoIIIAC/SpoIIIAD family protein [Angelakisella sp.]
MNLFSVTVFCLVGAILCLVLKQYKPEFALLISLGCSIVVMLFILEGITQVRDELDLILQNSMLNSDLMVVVFKCLGVCVLTELASQTCKDAGEGAIAAKVELAGKVSLLILSLPLFVRLLEVSTTLINLGGQ